MLGSPIQTAGPHIEGEEGEADDNDDDGKEIEEVPMEETIESKLSKYSAMDEDRTDMMIVFALHSVDLNNDH